MVAVACAVLGACYHQVVQTGRAPGATVVTKPWTATWIFGLVPAAPIDVSKECPSGIATVETQMTVPNALVSLLTLGIYTPRDVRVTCATGSALKLGLPELHVAMDASLADREQALVTAAEISARTHSAVVLRF